MKEEITRENKQMMRKEEDKGYKKHTEKERNEE
jgi:hypothetical protein